LKIPAFKYPFLKIPHFPFLIPFSDSPFPVLKIAIVEEFVDADILAQTLKKINKYNVKGARLLKRAVQFKGECDIT